MTIIFVIWCVAGFMMGIGWLSKGVFNKQVSLFPLPNVPMSRKIVALLISGPLIWLCVFFCYLFEIIGKWAKGQ